MGYDGSTTTRKEIIMGFFSFKTHDTNRSISNRHTLRREIRKYVGDTVNGIYITESGILAAAHLAGAGNVKKFFRRGYEFKDGNGTKMTSYMIMFADYDLKL